MLKELLKICFRPLTWLNRIVPKNKKMIFFYSNLGFRDNVKALYDYLIKEGYHKKYKIICAVNDYHKYADSDLKNVKFVGTKVGIIYFIRTRFGFYSFGKYPIKPSKSQTIVNLWHGMPLKKIGNMEPGLTDVDYNYFTYVLATSDFFADIMKKCFSCGDEQILINGQPRTDEMFLEYNTNEIQMRKEYQNIIVWFPTYRNTDKLPKDSANQWPIPLITIKEAEAINSLLVKSKSKMIIKLHPLQYSEKIKQFSNIEIINENQMSDKYGNIYGLLKLSDGLITDYSSVYFDYMLLDKPIAFTINDIDTYRDERGFVFDHPLDYMPGKQVKDFKDLAEFIDSIIHRQDEFRKSRNGLNNLANKYQDGNNSERIAARIIGGINE